MVFYEDIYGTVNPDEEFDRFPDACEDESDSDSSIDNTHTTQVEGSGIFKPFTSARKSATPTTARGRKAGAETGSKSSRSRSSTTPTSTARQHSDFNSSPSKKPRTKRFGMFSSAMDTSNNNDMVDSFMNGNLGDMDDVFPTLEDNTFPANPYAFDAFTSSTEPPLPQSATDKSTEQPLPTPVTSPQNAAPVVNMTSAATKPQQNDATMTQPTITEPATDDDGYAADQDDLRTEVKELSQPKRRGRPPGSANISKKREVITETLGRTRGATTKVKDASKRSLRPRAAEVVKPVPKSKRNKYTARAATLYKKTAKKVIKPVVEKVVKRRRLLRGTRKANVVRDGALYNWAGKQIKLRDGQGHVIADEEVEMGEYQKCY